MSHFHCYQCGACCRVPEVMAQFPHLDRGDGTCRHLIDNRCSIYNDRPLICRVDECYEQLFKNVMTREEYYQQQNEFCKQLRKPMIEIKTLEIAGMASVLQALRLPFGLECRSICESYYYRFPSEENVEYTEFNTRSECRVHRVQHTQRMPSTRQRPQAALHPHPQRRRARQGYTRTHRLCRDKRSALYMARTRYLPHRNRALGVRVDHAYTGQGTHHRGASRDEEQPYRRNDAEAHPILLVPNPPTHLPPTQEPPPTPLA